MDNFDNMLKKFIKESNRNNRTVRNRDKKKLEGDKKDGKVRQVREKGNE